MQTKEKRKPGFCLSLLTHLIFFNVITVSYKSLKYSHRSIIQSFAILVVFYDLTYISFPFYGVCPTKQSAFGLNRRRRHGDLQRGSAQRSSAVNFAPARVARLHPQTSAILSHQVSFTSLVLSSPCGFFHIAHEQYLGAVRRALHYGTVVIQFLKHVCVRK